MTRSSNRLQEIQDQSERLDRSFQKHLAQESEQKLRFESDAERIWYNYELSRQLLLSTHMVKIPVPITRVPAVPDVPTTPQQPLSTTSKKRKKSKQAATTTTADIVTFENPFRTFASGKIKYRPNAYATEKCTDVPAAEKEATLVDDGSSVESLKLALKNATNETRLVEDDADEVVVAVAEEAVAETATECCPPPTDTRESFQEPQESSVKKTASDTGADDDEGKCVMMMSALTDVTSAYVNNSAQPKTHSIRSKTLVSQRSENTVLSTSTDDCVDESDAKNKIVAAADNEKQTEAAADDDGDVSLNVSAPSKSSTKDDFWN